MISEKEHKKKRTIEITEIGWFPHEKTKYKFIPLPVDKGY